MAPLYPILNVLDGKALSEIFNDFWVKYPPTIKTSFIIWPPANLLILTFVPIQYQVLFNNFVSIFFNAYLSYIHNDYQKDTPFVES